jgi:hypothetical protein
MPKCYIDTTGAAETGYYTVSGCDEFYTELKKNLKISKYCANKAFEKGCIPVEYKDVNGCPGYSTSAVKGAEAWVTADGMTMFRYNGSYTYPMFGFDINGAKNPNKWGYDVFAVDIYYDNQNKIYLTDKTCGRQMVSDGGRKFTDMLKWVYE